MISASQPGKSLPFVTMQIYFYRRFHEKQLLSELAFGLCLHWQKKCFGGQIQKSFITLSHESSFPYAMIQIYYSLIDLTHYLIHHCYTCLCIGSDLHLYLIFDML